MNSVYQEIAFARNHTLPREPNRDITIEATAQAPAPRAWQAGTVAWMQRSEAASAACATAHTDVNGLCVLGDARVVCFLHAFEENSEVVYWALCPQSNSWRG
jgi:hypothetical protein